MAKRRTSDEWQELMTQFEASGESASVFCRSRGIGTSSFYKQRGSHASASPAFVVAQRVAPGPTQGPTASQISVQISDVVIRCDAQTSVTWVSQLIEAVRQ